MKIIILKGILISDDWKIPLLDRIRNIEILEVREE